ncbi:MULTISPECIES: siderophore-interacting protein [Streptomyces]|uniref:Siderophore-interacting protein n=1 Tax=Streptomyces tsukubensis (strain DSM 42081 / NBRC 108919 / NRRL 18488 / 9993) TaxID=1114943 RepID=I2N9W7_STRT9|nr:MULTISPECIES: siderophore-interacting protein [Streptomyces]AZK97644.1 siderophore-interacting protein [Streptomyces tsukubensis]EIF93814.1 putative siderophore-interacting protein [Streptomyces tsukubensis NRRL18488]MYS66402.1 SIP domain-containing protein [Streptomyces sp. SID5473]QKM66418.1 siderophore-interacting protein [Streptomyces tsukubensis NRRL18488]TAI45243.1 siderophore-interacting protein [Streptomyces tsukubensis]
MSPSFDTSPNVLFETRIRTVRRLSPGFVRLTLTGPGLAAFAPYGLDQRVKLLVPNGGYPAVFDEDLLTEARWRRRWRDLPAAERPVMRSYTTSGVRPGLREVDLDFYAHTRPGPASAWALSAREGERVLLSGPDARRGKPSYGVQWEPGPATRVLIAGDETAFPAIRNIVSTLGGSVGADIFLEVGDGADAVAACEGLDGRSPTVRRRTAGDPSGPLFGEIDAWIRSYGAEAAALGTGFYAWLATESTRVARLRDRLRDAGIASDRLHAQGYWHDRVRTS